jgi:hypothetical protein
MGGVESDMFADYDCRVFREDANMGKGNCVTDLHADLTLVVGTARDAVWHSLA